MGMGKLLKHKITLFRWSYINDVTAFGRKEPVILREQCLLSLSNEKRGDGGSDIIYGQPPISTATRDLSRAVCVTSSSKLPSPRSTPSATSSVRSKFQTSLLLASVQKVVLFYKFDQKVLYCINSLAF